MNTFHTEILKRIKTLEKQGIIIVTDVLGNFFSHLNNRYEPHTSTRIKLPQYTPVTSQEIEAIYRQKVTLDHAIYLSQE